MSLRDHLQSIYDAHQKLTPALLVDEARDEAHPLHDRFEWDDGVAGESWRRQQAHELIRSVRIVYRKATKRAPERSVRAYHAVRKESGHVYEPAEKVASDPLLQQMVLRDMEREWRQLKARYGHFQEFIDMVRGDLDTGEAA
jgi:hypothetical protein